MFALTGTKEEKKDILIDYLEKYNNNNNEFNKYRIIKSMKEENKNDFFNRIINLSKENMILVGSEIDYKNIDNDYIEDDITIFGVYGCHVYDFIKGEKHRNKKNKTANFFRLWNPHGSNPNPEEKTFEINFDNLNFFYKMIYKIIGKENFPGYYKYEGFDQINLENEIGFNNGDIILDIDRFLYAFEEIYCQNRKQVSTNYNKYHKKEGNFLNSAFIKMLPFYQFYFINLFNNRLDYVMAKLFLGIYKNKDTKKEVILKEIMNDEKVENDKAKGYSNDIFLYKTSEIDLEENNKNIKNEILNKSKSIMIEKAEKGMNSKNADEIFNILIETNNKTNEFLIFSEKKNFSLLKETKNEIIKIAKEIADNIIKKK